MAADAVPNSPSLRNSLLAALVFFDLFDYPLTFAELLRFRYVDAHALIEMPGSFAASKEPGISTASLAADALAVLRNDPAFGQKDGMWFLAGREAVTETRQRRFRLSARKMVRARRVAAWLRLLPSVRMVAVCNSLAIENADRESDIDLFVVCAPGTLWVTRLIAVGALALLRLRPDEKTHADRVCMSFFVSESALDLSRFALAPDDTYLRYWTATLLPVHDVGDTYRRFMGANGWIRERLPGIAPQTGTAVPIAAAGWPTALFRAANAVARRLQIRRFPSAITAIANLDSRVVISDDVLKFHVGDRRAEYESRFREKLAQVPDTSAAAAKTRIPA